MKAQVKIKDIIKLIIFLSIGIFLIWLFVRKLTPDEVSDIINSLKNVRYQWLLLAFIFGVISVFARASRWIILIEPLGYKPKYKNVFFSVLIAYLANLAIPRLGEVSRCGVLTKYDKIPFEKSFGTVITERICDLLVFFLLLFLNIIIQYNVLKTYIDDKILGRMHGTTGKFHMLIIIGIVGVVFVALLWFLIKKFPNNKPVIKIKSVLKGLWDGIKSFSQIKRPWAFLFHTILLWGCYFLMTRIMFEGLIETSMLGNDAAFSSLVFSTIGNILVQGGIGIYPLIVSEVLTVYGCTPAIGYTSGWLIWLNQTVLIIVGGIVAFIVLPLVNKENNRDTEKTITYNENKANES